MIDFGRRRPLLLVLAILLIFSCLPSAVGAETALLPAQDWNLRNLQRLQALQPDTLTFAVLGDNRGNLPILEQLLRQMSRDPELQFAIHLGDMVEKGELPRYRRFVQSVRQNLPMPLLAVIGNHELAGDPEGTRYTGIFGPRDFSFRLESHYFIMFDDNAKSGPDAAQRRWLEGELQKARSYKTRLVFLHVPLFDPRGGAHHHCLPPQSARRLQVLFKKYRVTCVFAGHIHSYFEGRWDGVPYAITAGAGAPLYGKDPQHFFYHYLKVTLQGDRVQIQVRRLEEVIRDPLVRPKS
jgi:3',5'-cyclic AMP phosphodiesterase CpdA